jgi:hypothetical protein
MLDGSAANRTPTGVSARRRSPAPIELWRLRGAADDLRALAVETSFGYALGLELDTELVLLSLQPSLDTLVAYAERIQRALQPQGWTPVEDALIGRSHHASR